MQASPPTLKPAIPKGLDNKAQGCEARATLGKRAKRSTKPEGLASQAGSPPTPSRTGTKAPSTPGSEHLALVKTRSVADAAVALRALRREIMQGNGCSLRELYRTLETPGANRFRDAHADLNATAGAA
jgi:hypothetical protein